jgi:hypothetical protein
MDTTHHDVYSLTMAYQQDPGVWNRVIQDTPQQGLISQIMLTCY